MPIKRPIIDFVELDESAFVIVGSTITTFMDITPGPGLVKGGGIDLNGIISTSDVDFLIEVDGVIVFDIQGNKLDEITGDGPTAGMTIVTTGTTINMDLDENVNWGFISNLKFQLRKNTAGDDPISIQGVISFHRGS